MSVGDPRAYFEELITWAQGRLQADEVLLANFAGERSDFVRFNNADIRQAGSVSQASMDLDLICGQRHVEGSVQLTNDRDMDRTRVLAMLDQLREQRGHVPEDPYLLYNTEPIHSEFSAPNKLPPPEQAVSDIRTAAAESDLVGIYAAGEIFTGFANSLGQRNWHEAASFNLDWSFYLRADKAAKNAYAGFEWDNAAFARKVASSRQQLAVLDRRPVELKPGRYRAYLAPAAIFELIELWAWSAFGERSHQTRRTPLIRMVTEDAVLSPAVHMAEDTAGGVAPKFQNAGFVRPDQVPLIDGGVYRNTLVSPRSAREYDVPTNGAPPWESPDALAMAPGSLSGESSTEALGTGLHVGNLHYTNFSDRATCRTTGMTRFATFWAEGGEIVAPVNVMRFDDTIYNLLGQNLVDLTDHTEMILDSDSYERRSTASFRLPGVLVEEMAFTL